MGAHNRHPAGPAAGTGRRAARVRQTRREPASTARWPRDFGKLPEPLFISLENEAKRNIYLRSSFKGWTRKRGAVTINKH